MATITISKAYMDGFGNLKLTFVEELPAIQYDDVKNEAAEVAVHEIAIHFRAVVAQLIELRPELADVYNQIKFMPERERPSAMTDFITIITSDAKWDIEPKKHCAGEKFEDGHIARYDGYIYTITSATFADEVEAVLKPKSLKDALSRFGR